MFDQKLFQHNLKLLSAINPTLAEKVKLVPSGKINESTKKEIEEWFGSLQLANIMVLYIYGIGSGDVYEVISPWLAQNSSRYVVFLEDDLGALSQFLSSTKATPLLSDIQVDIQDVSNAAIERRTIRLLTEDNMLRPATVTALPSYQKNKFSDFSLIRDLILFETTEQNIVFRELANYGILFYKNFYPNLLELPLAYDGQGLFNKFKNIPAIICGAGPSLNKQIPMLRKNYGKALIFAPSSSQSALTAQGVWPHFGVTLDPSVNTFQQQYMQRGFEVPVFYQNRIYNEALQNMHGPRLFLPDETFYLIEDWFEEQLNLNQQALEGGYSSISAALIIAQALGCNPIIFVGVELSKSQVHYSSGIEHHPLYPFAQDLKPELGSPIQAKDIDGNEITTYWPWIAEAQWIDKFNRLNPATTLINATEAGIGLFSVQNIPLEEVYNKFLTKGYDLDALVHDAIQEAGPMPVTGIQVRDSLETFFQSVKRCEELCRQIDQSISSNPDTQTKLEKQLKKEPGYQYLLIQLETFFLTFIQKELRNLPRLPIAKERAQKKQYLDHMLYRFLKQTLDINLQMIALTLNRNSSEQIPCKSKSVEQVEDNTKRVFHYPSGTIYSVQSFDNDIRDGPHTYYYPNGTIKSEITYRQGFLHGPTKLYYPTGKVKRELYFQEGRREGIETSWYENGQKFTQVEYHNNEAKHASCWHMNGAIAKDLQL